MESTENAPAFRALLMVSTDHPILTILAPDTDCELVGESDITICSKDGRVILREGLALDEAARKFWRAVELVGYRTADRV